MAAEHEAPSPHSPSDRALHNELRTVLAERDEVLERLKSVDLRLHMARMAADDQAEEQRVAHAQQVTEAVAKERARVQATQDKDVFRRVTAQRLQRAGRGAAHGESLVVNSGLGSEYFYASLHHRDVWVFERLAMQNQSIAARRVIGRAVTALGPGLDQVLRVARFAMTGAIDPSALAVYDSWSRRSLLSLARVFADQNLLSDDTDTAVSLYHLAWLLWGASSFEERHALIFTELLEDTQRPALADRFREDADIDAKFPVQAALLSANRHARSTGHDGAWLADLNAQLAANDLAEVEVAGGHSDLLTSLRSEAPPVDGPLVSVIMPTHNGSAHLETAIRSVLSQTWRNLELLLIDDCSDGEHRQQLPGLIPDDPRVKVFHLDQPAGAYGARMFAFQRAAGEFVTIHDDDDWSHPQKVERQVRHLMDHPEEVANMSFQTRIDEDGLFLRINDNPNFSQPNYSSLLIRRTDAEALGAWDVVNRGADAEFHDRVRVLTGKRVAAVNTPPLSFMRARAGSLTHGEIRKGALDPARVTYSLSAAAWHQQLTDDKLVKIESVSDETGRFPYPIPANFRVGSRLLPKQAFEVVLATDMRFPGGNSTLAAAELNAMAGEELNLGTIHLPSPVLRSRRPMNHRIHSAIARHGIPLLSVQDDVAVELLLLRHPTVAQFIDNLDARVRARRTLLIANTPPVNSDGRDFCYEIAECAANAQKVFGGEVLVVAESPQTGHLLRKVEPNVEIANFIWPGFLDDEGISQSPREAAPDRLPVVGRHSRDHRLKWPDSPEEIAHTYLGHGAFRTTILGGASSISEVVDMTQHGVKVLEFGSQEPEEYLRGIDFWVYQHSREWTESFGMAILEAMASGCVVVLPHYLRELFGDGALYCTPEEVRELVQDTWSSPERFRSQSAKSLETARAQFSTTAYLERVRGVLASEPING